MELGHRVPRNLRAGVEGKQFELYHARESEKRKKKGERSTQGGGAESPQGKFGRKFYEFAGRRKKRAADTPIPPDGKWGKGKKRVVCRP